MLERWRRLAHHNMLLSAPAGRHLYTVPPSCPRSRRAGEVGRKAHEVRREWPQLGGSGWPGGKAGWAPASVSEFLTHFLPVAIHCFCAA